MHTGTRLLISGVQTTSAERLRTLEESNKNLSTALQSFIDEVSQLRSSMLQPVGTLSPNNDPFLKNAFQSDERSLQRQPSFKWDVKPQKSPTKADNPESPFSSPQRPEHDISGQNRAAGSSAQSPLIDKSRVNNPETPSKPAKQESADNLKSFKVSLEDPTWKVLPAALKKYRIHNDTWQNYAMFICYGPSGMPFPNITSMT
jgi:bZIP factor